MSNQPFTLSQVRPIREAHDRLPPGTPRAGSARHLVLTGRRHFHHPGILRLHTLYLGGEGSGTFVLGNDGRTVAVCPGQLLAVPPKTLCGTRTDTGMILH